MAESSSTGNSGTTGTTGNSGTTSTSTSNGGAAASGSQSSSNGSFSTGKGSGNNGNNGNNGVGPGLSFGAGLASNTGSGWSSNSNGNFSGGLNGTTNGFTGFASDNFGQGWGGSYSISPDSEGKHTIKPNAEGKHVVTQKYSKPQSQALYMTVDEVYGKGNQSMVESQGDYEASSNEKSNVETSTFGKQDEISVTPLSVTEDKGMVDNAAIQSVEGLNFQQKDKANQEVMEAKKSRDDAEAEDNADGMRDQLKAVAEKDEETETDAFKVGESEAEKAFKEEDASKQKQLKQMEAEAKEAKNKQEKLEAKAEKAKKAYEEKSKELYSVIERNRQIVDRLNEIEAKTAKDGKDETAKYEMVKSINDEFNLGLDAFDLYNPNRGNMLLEKIGNEKANLEAECDSLMEAESIALMDARKAGWDANKKQNVVNKAKQEYDSWKTEAWSKVENANVESPTVEAEAPTTEAPSYKASIEAARNEIINSKDLTDEQKSETLSVLGNVESAAGKMNEAANNLAKNPNDINAVQQYIEETARYNKALKDAKGDKTLKNTDFNKTFTKAVAVANDFMVTKEDGTQQSYAEFAAEMATKSPELAKGLYEAKAKNYEENGHKVLAAIETAKSKMVMTWLGSKFTFADNQVRGQFNQMAKTDMRATYATYNNVLNDETGKYSEADKAEASAAINQANSLMTASAALQASTGFLSGIGDSMSDGEYGKTDPGKLNGYQKALNAASNLAKVVLGLGVTPGANEAYQNMYYLASDKVKNSMLFGRDFDGDGFALCQGYGNNAAVGMIAGAGELATGVALMFNPATSKIGINLAIDAVQTFLNGLYGVQKEANKSIKYSEEILKYFSEAKSIAAETDNKEIVNAMSTTMDSAVKQIEDFQLKSDEVGNLDNWLEGSGSNTVDNGKFNQALSYDEWLKLIEADPVMQEYAKSLNR